MGNLDGRIEQDKGPSPEAMGGTKDGPTGTETTKAPEKTEDTDRKPAKKTDVLHGGEQ
ncbi:hypothetical protein [Beijerinckia sp. L45]|uniref:hypothetical protein n=1 Tax=Beijerinckia sp. L45 TaxID=1641855 RepID=UPI00131D767A|nr:hypothetical protein [Beijerinckia sp. L45]